MRISIRTIQLLEALGDKLAHNALNSVCAVGTTDGWNYIRVDYDSSFRYQFIVSSGRAR